MDSNNILQDRIARLEKMILDQKTVLSFSEASDYTGFSRSYLYKLTSSGTIPHYKPTGKMLYFRKSELDEWVLSHKVDRQSSSNQ